MPTNDDVIEEIKKNLKADPTCWEWAMGDDHSKAVPAFGKYWCLLRPGGLYKAFFVNGKSYPESVSEIRELEKRSEKPMRDGKYVHYIEGPQKFDITNSQYYKIEKFIKY